MTFSEPQGDELRPAVFPPITRTQLALFAGGSGDHNPMHIDSDFARSAGMGDVFAHGMLVMALMGRALTTWFSPAAVRRTSARFTSMTQVGDTLTCRGFISRVEDDQGVVTLQITNQDGTVRMTGEAAIRMEGFSA
jgi:acyl dehydratase